MIRKQQAKEILDRVLTWSRARQEDAAKLLTLVETRDGARFWLTDDQVEDVKRRRLDPNRRTLTLDEARERLGRLLDQSGSQSTAALLGSPSLVADHIGPIRGLVASFSGKTA